MKLVIGVTAFNVEEYIVRCINSIKTQNYKNFVCYIIDDLSTDNTVKLIKKAIKEDKRFKLVVNKEKRYQCGNYDLICRDRPSVKDEDIFLEVDGDDFLPDNEVFDRVIAHYNDKNVWIAYGNFMFLDGKIGFSSPIKDLSNIRNENFTASHLRTWKIFLWRALDQKDLKDEKGNWWVAGSDLIFMYNMLEMAGIEHYKYMPEINYVYNDKNPISDGRIALPYVNDLVEYVKIKQPKTRITYEPLD